MAEVNCGNCGAALVEASDIKPEEAAIMLSSASAFAAASRVCSSDGKKVDAGGAKSSGVDALTGTLINMTAVTPIESRNTRRSFERS
jgi:hypothetical protein